MTKQFQNKLKETDKLLQDPKTPIDKKINMMYERTVKAVKDLGQYKKQQILLEKKISQMKQEIEEKRVSLEKQEKQKTSLMNLFNGLQEKNLEAS